MRMPPGPGYPAPARTSVQTHLLIAASIGLVFGLGVFVARAPVPRALGAGFVLALASYAPLRAMDVPRIEWPSGLTRRSRLTGIQRWRLSGFDALTDRNPGLSEDLRLRMSRLAVAILARRQLHPGEQRAITLLGRGTHDLLFPPQRAVGDRLPREPSGAELTAMIDRLICLGSGTGDPSVPSMPSEPASNMEGQR